MPARIRSAVRAEGGSSRPDGLVAHLTFRYAVRRVEDMVLDLVIAQDRLRSSDDHEHQIAPFTDRVILAVHEVRSC